MDTDMAVDSYVCHVCGEEAAAAATSECNWCDQRFHLNQRNDVEGKDCGEVWIDEQYLALQFACNTCLSGGKATSPNNPAVDGSAGASQERRRRYTRRS